MVVEVLIWLPVVFDTSDTVSLYPQSRDQFMATRDTSVQGFSSLPSPYELDVVHLAWVFLRVLELQLYFSTRDIQCRQFCLS